MTRIRYKDVNGLLISPEYLAVNRLLKVTIYPQVFEVILTEGENVVHHTINLGNLQNAKKVAKKMLVEMGVNFQPEVRPRLSMDSDFCSLKHELIKDDLGPNASKTYKEDLFEEDDVQ